MAAKSYLVIGGSSGIGLDVCRLLAKEGNSLFIVSSSKRKLEATSLELATEYQCECSIFAYDLDNLSEICTIFEEAMDLGFLFDGMVYCAGISPLQLVGDNDWKLGEKVYRINVLAFIECVKYFYNNLYSKDGSKIVAISSVAAKASGYRQTLYGSSKAALTSAVKLMAKEMLNRGIHVNCVSPASTKTEMLEDLYRDKDSLEDSVKLLQPLGVIEPSAVAELVVSLLSSLSDYLTGSEIVYDAGFQL